MPECGPVMVAEARDRKGRKARCFSGSHFSFATVWAANRHAEARTYPKARLIKWLMRPEAASPFGEAPYACRRSRPRAPDRRTQACLIIWRKREPMAPSARQLIRRDSIRFRAHQLHQ